VPFSKKTFSYEWGGAGGWGCLGDDSEEVESMIARIWHGKTKARDATAYLEYLFKSGIPAYRATSGNKGAWVLRRIENDVAHFITLSFWESREAIAAFAGPDIGVAKYYPEDEKYLLEFEPGVTHYELFQ
jgi:heme-degrading monooxygenase HmoA